MPTSKKAPVKKTVVRKKAVATKTRKTTHKQAPSHRSFRPAVDRTPFMTFHPTRQTFYWAILSAVIFFFGTWIVHLQLQVQDLYNQIDIDNNTALIMPHKVVKH